MATPSSTRSRPARHVWSGTVCSDHGRRCSASRPQRTPLSSTHPATRSSVVVVEAEAATDRRSAGEAQDLGGGEAVVEEVEEVGEGAEQRVGLAQRAVGEAVGEHRRARQRVLVVEAPGAEGGVQQRRVLVDVGAQDDDVARLERRVGGEQVADRVAEHLDLAPPAVAGVDLDRAVAGLDRRTGCAGGGVVPDGVLEPSQPRPRPPSRRRRAVRDLGLGSRGQDQLHLAAVVGPGGEQRVARHPSGRVVGPRQPCRHRRHHVGVGLGDVVPQGQRRVQGVEVHVAVRGEGAEHLQVRGGQAGQPEQRHPLGHHVVERDRVGAEAVAGGRDPLGRRRHGQVVPHATQQLGLPAGVGRQVGVGRVVVAGAVEPRQDHRGAEHAVAVEEPGDVPGGRLAAPAPQPVVLVSVLARSAHAEVRADHAQPRLARGTGRGR